MNWLPYAILAAASFGFYNFFTKISADKFSPSVANIFIAGTSFLVAVIMTVYLKISGQELVFTKESLKYPILAGLFTGAAEIFYLTTFAKHAPLTIGSPLVISGATLGAVLLGFIILREPMSAAKIVGIIVTLVGLAILARS